MRKHFQLEISDTSLRFERRAEQIAQEAALDGIYVLRTSVAAHALEAPAVVRAYKQLKEVERAFRTHKGPLELRPIHHRLEQRVKAHVFLCMLAYYLAWHLRQAWKPLLFDDEAPPQRPDPVAKARRSATAARKAQTKRTASGEPCHSLTTLLDELATRSRNDPPPCQRRDLRAAHQPNPHPGARARSDRQLQPKDVADRSNGGGPSSPAETGIRPRSQGN